MNELMPEFPKILEVKCYHPIGKWNIRSVSNEQLCKNCLYFQKKFLAQYEELIHSSPIGD